MRTVLEAAVGLPTILLTAALVVIVGFWLLVAVGAAAVGSFDEDVDLGSRGLDGVPVVRGRDGVTVIRRRRRREVRAAGARP